MNTLPYYIHNLLYYIIDPSDDHDLLTAFKKDVSKFNKLLKTSSVATEDAIYTEFCDLIKKILTTSAPAASAPAASAPASDIEKYIYKLCVEYYYKNTNCDHYLLKKGNRGIFLGGADFPPSEDEEDEKTVSNLAKISFKNPYYLLNHVSMELCLLQNFYNEINDKLSKDDTFNDEMKKKIKSFYNNVIKDNIKDVEI
jgi:hypothetical protein